MSNQFYMKTFTTPDGKKSFEISPKADIFLYEKDGKYFARIALGDMVAAGDTKEEAVDKLADIFFITIFNHFLAGDLQDVLMKYGWSAEFHNDEQIVCIEPPMKATFMKSKGRFDDFGILINEHSLEPVTELALRNKKDIDDYVFKPDQFLANRTKKKRINC